MLACLSSAVQTSLFASTYGDFLDPFQKTIQKFPLTTRMLPSGTVRAEQDFLAGVPPGDTDMVLSWGVESRRLFVPSVLLLTALWRRESLTESLGVKNMQMEGREASEMRERTEGELIQHKKNMERTSNWVGTRGCGRERGELRGARGEGGRGGGHTGVGASGLVGGEKRRFKDGTLQ